MTYRPLVCFAVIAVSSAVVLTVAGCGKPSPVDVTEVSASPDVVTEVAAAEPTADENEWTSWRGPNGDGTAPDQSVPTEWNDQTIAWKVPVPGRGHASPTIAGDLVVIETADEEQQVQSVLAFDRKTGEQVWKTDLHEGNFETSMHDKNTHATSTVAFDGERLFATFLNDKKIWVTALDLKGKKIWQNEVGGFTAKFGYSASPTIYKGLLIVAADNHGGGWLAGLNRETGKTVWLKKRPAKATYASPIVFNVGGKDQLVIAGCDQVVSYDPNTGDQYWAVDGTTEACVGTVVRHNDWVYASGGYPGSETVCIDAGTGEIVWKNGDKAYVPSLLQYDGYLYSVDDGGVAVCWNAETGEEQWKQRVGGKFSASPILVGENIIVIDENGKATIFKANPQEFERIVEHQIADEAFATPAINDNRLYLRVAEHNDGRQEFLYCIGSPDVAVSQAAN